MNDLKSLLHVLSFIVIMLALGVTGYIVIAETFTLPLGLLVLIAGLTALWLQQEAK